MHWLIITIVPAGTLPQMILLCSAAASSTCQLMKKRITTWRGKMISQRICIELFSSNGRIGKIQKLTCPVIIAWVLLDKYFVLILSGVAETILPQNNRYVNSCVPSIKKDVLKRKIHLNYSVLLPMLKSLVPKANQDLARKFYSSHLQQCLQLS